MKNTFICILLTVIAHQALPAQQYLLDSWRNDSWHPDIKVKTIQIYHSDPGKKKAKKVPAGKLEYNEKGWLMNYRHSYQGGWKKAEYRYDQQGNRIAATELETDQEGHVTRTTEYQREYNKKGFLTREKRKMNSHRYSKTEYEYQAGGNTQVIKKNTLRYYGGKYNLSQKESRAYQRGQLLWSSDGNHTINYEYGPHGLVKAQLECNPRARNFQPCYYEIREYDDRGRVKTIRHDSSFWEDAPYYQSLLEYNDLELLSTETLKGREEKVWKVHYEYDLYPE